MLKKFLAMFTAVVIFLSVPLTTFAATGTIKGNPNFRAAPSTSSKVYQNLKSGQKVEVLQKTNAYWVKVRANGRTGYISSKYITIGSSSKSSSSSKKASSSKAKANPTVKSNAIIRTGNSLLGTPYKFGATYEKNRRFDCSSFVQYVFKKNGYTLPRSTKQQVKMGTAVSRSNLKKGDLMFFKVNGSKNIGHVAIYAGGGRMIHTYGKGGVRYDSINSSYWKRNYVTARRIIRW